MNSEKHLAEIILKQNKKMRKYNTRSTHAHTQSVTMFPVVQKGKERQQR